MAQTYSIEFKEEAYKRVQSEVPAAQVVRGLESGRWRCTMVWVAYLGLQRSLEDVGAVLGLDKQKLSESAEKSRSFLFYAGIDSNLSWCCCHLTTSFFFIIYDAVYNVN